MAFISKQIQGIATKPAAFFISFSLCILFILPYPAVSYAAIDLNDVWWEDGINKITITHNSSGLSGTASVFNFTAQYKGEEDGYTKFKGTCYYTSGGTDTIEIWYDPDIPNRVTHFIYDEHDNGGKEYFVFNYPFYRYIQQHLVIEKDTAAEPSTTARFFVTRSQWDKKARNIGCSISGTASMGMDYTLFPKNLKFEEDQQTAMFTLAPLDDQEVEGTETVVLEVIKDYRTNETVRGVITIADNDHDPGNDPGEPGKPIINISSAYPYAYELDSVKGKFILNREGSNENDLLVEYAISGTAINGTDYLKLPGSITIPAGKSSAVLIIDPIQDFVQEDDETVSITLKENPSYIIDTDSTAEISIVDNSSGSAYQYSLQENVPLDKFWTVRFNRSVDLDCISNRNIYITDSSGFPINVTTVKGNNDQLALIFPVNDYQVGQSYKLYVNNLKSADGKFLNQPYVKPFTAS